MLLWQIERLGGLLILAFRPQEFFWKKSLLGKPAVAPEHRFLAQLAMQRRLPPPPGRAIFRRFARILGEAGELCRLSGLYRLWRS
jgi:hypothetical protein